MPWTNQGGGGGGPWGGGGGGGGSGGGGGGGQNPWGRPGGPRQPDLEELLRKGQEKVRSMMPGTPGGLRGLWLLGLLTVILWGASGFFKVEPDEQGVVLRFGAWVRNAPPGLNYHIPAPIETVLTPRVTRTNRVDIGFRGAGDGPRVTPTRDVPEESLMLTQDENIVDIDFTVFWKIKDAGDYLFSIRDPDDTVKIAAESAMREVVGQTPIQRAFTVGREDIENRTAALLQKILDSYSSGVLISKVQLLKVDPPTSVIDAFNDVQRAKQDKARLQNEADTYAKDIVPRARGEARRMNEEAKAYQAQIVDAATGDASRFLAVYESYRQAPDVTQKRLYLETMEQVLAGATKVIVDRSAGGPNGVLPYLPLPQLRAQDKATETKP